MLATFNFILATMVSAGHSTHLSSPLAGEPTTAWKSPPRSAWAGPMLCADSPHNSFPAFAAEPCTVDPEWALWVEKNHVRHRRTGMGKEGNQFLVYLRSGSFCCILVERKAFVASVKGDINRKINWFIKCTTLHLQHIDRLKPMAQHWERVGLGRVGGGVMFCLWFQT